MRALFTVCSSEKKIKEESSNKQKCWDKYGVSLDSPKTDLEIKSGHFMRGFIEIFNF
jgi:hypothetical protein